MKKFPFNLAAALAGKPLVTQDGRPARGFKRVNPTPEAVYKYAATIGLNTLETSFTKDGLQFGPGCHTPSDLFMTTIEDSNYVAPPVQGELDATGKPLSYAPNPPAERSAGDYLREAAEIMAERGRQYDSPKGERSMGKCVAAFNAITGRDLTESEGWLLMLVLKQVRQFQNAPHLDSAQDGVAYAALLAEARMTEKKQ